MKEIICHFNFDGVQDDIGVFMIISSQINFNAGVLLLNLIDFCLLQFNIRLK